MSLRIKTLFLPYKKHNFCVIIWERGRGDDLPQNGYMTFFRRRYPEWTIFQKSFLKYIFPILELIFCAQQLKISCYRVYLLWYILADRYKSDFTCFLTFSRDFKRCFKTAMFRPLGHPAFIRTRYYFLCNMILSF